MPFLKRGSLFGLPAVTLGGPDRAAETGLNTIITNSGVLSIGDVVSSVAQAAGNGGVVRRYNAAGDKILGVCIGFGRANGRSVTFDAGSSTTVTVAADNETVAQIYAIVEITLGAIYSANLSAAIHGTAIARLAAFCDPDTGANAGRVLETSVTVTQSTERALAILGPDPKDTTRVNVVIVEGIIRGANAAS